MVEGRVSSSGGGGWLLRECSRWAGGVQWQHGRRRAQKPSSLSVKEGLACVTLSAGACRPPALPGRKAHGDGLDHSLKIGRKRIKVVVQRGVDALLQCAEHVVDAMPRPRKGSCGVPPPSDGAELMFEKMDG